MINSEILNIGVSSHHLYYEKTKNVLHKSLLTAGVPESSIYYFVADPDVPLGDYSWDDENVCRIGHNSFDMNAYVSVVEQNLKSKRWFFTHDTTFVGPNFYNILLNYDYDGKDVVTLMPSHSYGPMWIGSYSWNALEQLKPLIVSSYKNQSFDKSTSNSFKSFLVKMEGKTEVYMKTPHYYSQREIRGVSTEYYGCSTPRLLEYFSGLDLYKTKANWFDKSNWTVQP